MTKDNFRKFNSQRAYLKLANHVTNPPYEYEGMITEKG